VLTEAILRLVGQGPPEGRRRQALEAIHDCPGWELANYPDRLGELGFPDTKAGLRRWLDGQGE